MGTTTAAIPVLSVMRKLTIGSFLAIALSGTAIGAANDGFHDDFDAVLKEHVDDGYVDYPGIAADARFASYIDSLKAPVAADLSPDVSLAYWINAYNALAIKGILDGNSPKKLLGRSKFFKRIEYQVGGLSLNLYDLEHDFIIATGEARIHFAIVCASFSCPALRSEAFVADKLDAQLDAQTAGFLSDATKNRFDTELNTAHLSRIFDWYAKDFEKAAGSVQRFIAPYVEDRVVATALEAESFRIKHLKYDWSLNGKPL